MWAKSIVKAIIDKKIKGKELAIIDYRKAKNVVSIVDYKSTFPTLLFGQVKLALNASLRLKRFEQLLSW